MFDSIIRTHAPYLWERGLRGNGVRVGVVGTGVDLRHPDFAGARIQAFSIIGGDTEDHTEHDTGVVWVIHRIAPAAEITLIKAQQNENGSLFHVIESLEKLRELHMDLINLSMCTKWPSDGTDPLSREANYLVQQGIVMVAAAGNWGPRKGTIGAPGAAEYAITVGKVDERNFVTRDSSRGPTIDGRMKPDLVAPGKDVVAAVPLASGTRLGIYNCTSFSTPHVTGVLALLKGAFPVASPKLLKDALRETCDPILAPFPFPFPFPFHIAPCKSCPGRRQCMSTAGNWRRSCDCGAGLLNAEAAYGWLKDQ